MGKNVQKPEHAKNAIQRAFDVWSGIIVTLVDCHFHFVVPLLMIVIRLLFDVCSSGFEHIGVGLGGIL